MDRDLTKTQQAVLKAVRIAGSQKDLAEMIGVSPQAVNKAAITGGVSPETAIAIETATQGRVRKGDLRPDLWPTEVTKEIA